MSLKKQKFHGKAVEVTVNNKEENSEDFCLDFVQEFGLINFHPRHRRISQLITYSPVLIVLVTF
jgi:hypothetical protein